ncbi:MAG: hypothetical protein ACKV1O_20445 [Saprospiraceae bacterium]
MVYRMIKQATLAAFFLLTTIALSAQSDDSLLLTKNFLFKDGVYLSLEALHRNSPDYAWDELEALLTTSARAFVAKVAKLKTKSGEIIDLHSVLAISLEGVPYVRVVQTREAELRHRSVTDPSRERTELRLTSTSLSTSSSVTEPSRERAERVDMTREAEPPNMTREAEPSRERQAVLFAGLKVRGKIAYFSYETDTTELVEISAYNPLTRRPFRKGYVPVKSSVTVEKIFYFPDGRIADFNRDRMLEWIGDDKQLWNTVNELGDDPTREKLYKCLLIYDDRNGFYMKGGG